MLENIEVLIQSCIKFSKGQIIYFDPFRIEKNYNDADIVFITHNHYDHFSKEDVELVKNDNTKFVAPKDVADELNKMGIDLENIIAVEPYSSGKIGKISFKAVPAYNVGKKFHPKANGWVGYIVETDGVSYYVAGDTDVNEDILKLECDVAFVPVGGTYTMNYSEAAELVNSIKPKIAVPIHYGSIVGTEEDAKNFVGLLDDGIEGKITL